MSQDLQRLRERKLIFAGDEFYNSPVFVMAMAAMYEDQLPRFDAQWEQLQLRVKAELLRDAPRLAGHPKLQGGGLPEIHAVALLQSEDYYRLKPSDPGHRPLYWRRQQAWIGEALKIIRHFNLKLFFLSKHVTKEGIRERAELTLKLFNEYTLAQRGRVYQAHAERFSQLLSSPYFNSFPSVVLGVDRFLHDGALNGRLLFDDFDECKGFSEGAVFDFMRQRRLFGSLEAVEYRSSEAHSLIQAADVAAYVYGRAIHSVSHKPGDPLLPLLRGWTRGFLLPRLGTPDGALTYDTSTAALMHYAFISSRCVPPDVSPGTFEQFLAAFKREQDSKVSGGLLDTLFRNGAK